MSNIDNILQEVDQLRNELARLQDEASAGDPLPQYSSTVTSVNTNGDGSVDITLTLYPGNDGIADEPIDAEVIEDDQVPGPADLTPENTDALTPNVEDVTDDDDNDVVAIDGEAIIDTTPTDEIPPGEVPGE